MWLARRRQQHSTRLEELKKHSLAVLTTATATAAWLMLKREEAWRHWRHGQQQELDDEGSADGGDGALRTHGW